MSARYVVTGCEYHEELDGEIVEITETLPTGTAYVTDAHGQRYALKLRYLMPHTPDLDGLRAYLPHAGYDRGTALDSRSGAAISVNIALGGLHIPPNTLKADDAAHAVRMAFLTHVCGRTIKSSTKDGKHKVAGTECLTFGEAWAIARWLNGQELNGNGSDAGDPALEWARHDEARAWIEHNAPAILGDALLRDRGVERPACYCCGAPADHLQVSDAFGWRFDLCARCAGDLYGYEDERYGRLWVFNCTCPEHTANHIARERFWRALDEYNTAFGERKLGPRSNWREVDWQARLDDLIAEWTAKAERSE